MREYGADVKSMEECNVESSAYEWNWLFGEERRSLIKIKKNQKECWRKDGTLRGTAVDKEGGRC